MSKEFADFMYRLNKEPVEKQLTELKQIMINLGALFEKLIAYYDNELDIIHYKIISLETKSTIIKLPKPQIPPPPPIDKKNLKSVILNELEELLKEKKRFNQIEA